MLDELFVMFWTLEFAFWVVSIFPVRIIDGGNVKKLETKQIHITVKLPDCLVMNEYFIDMYKQNDMGVHNTPVSFS